MQDVLTALIQKCSGRKLTEKDTELIRVTLDSCFELPKEIEDIRPSSVAFKNCVKWGGTIENALASSLLTLNSQHGPFKECYNLIDNYFINSIDISTISATLLMSDGYRLPGFGNPVIKDNDKRCENIETELHKLDTKYYQLKVTFESLLERTKEKRIKANLVYYVCCVSHYLGLPPDFSSILAIIGFQFSYINRHQKDIWQSQH